MGRCFTVIDLVGKVGKKGLPGAQVVDQSKGFLHVHVRGVGAGAQCIHDESIEIVQQGHTGGGNFFHVTDVGEGMASGEIEPESEGLDGGVEHRNGCNTEIVNGEWLRNETRSGSDIISGSVRHGPRKHALERSHGFWTRKQGKGVFPVPAEGPQFIKARDMVEVAVGVEDGINVAQALAEGLLTKVRPAVYQNRSPGRLKVQGGAGSPVPGVVRSTDCAGTPDNRNSHRGSGAQERCDYRFSIHGLKMQLQKSFATKDRGAVETGERGQGGRGRGGTEMVSGNLVASSSR